MDDDNAVLTRIIVEETLSRLIARAEEDASVVAELVRLENLLVDVPALP